MKKIIITKDGKDYVISQTKKGDTTIREFAHSPEYIKKMTLQMANDSLEAKIKELKEVHQSEEKINKKYDIPINVSAFFTIGSLPFLAAVPATLIIFAASVISLAAIYKAYNKSLKNNHEIQKQICQLEEIIKRNTTEMPDGFSIIKDEHMQTNQTGTAITTIDEEEINKITEEYLKAYQTYEANKEYIQMTYNHGIESFTIFLKELGLNDKQITIVCNLVVEDIENNLALITEEYINSPKIKTLNKVR